MTNHNLTMILLSLAIGFIVGSLFQIIRRGKR